MKRRKRASTHPAAVLRRSQEIVRMFCEMRLSGISDERFRQFVKLSAIVDPVATAAALRALAEAEREQEEA